MAKAYKNAQLEKYLKSQIAKMSIDKKYKPYVVDILMRRVYQFELSPEQIQLDVSTLQGSLKQISIVEENQMDVDNAWGAYYPMEKAIKLNKNIFNGAEFLSSEEIYQVLSKTPS